MQQGKTFIEASILQRFEVIRKVGSGGYGHVWRVQERSTLKIYALKKIFDAFQHSKDAQRTFRQIQILQQTEHANIIKLREVINAREGNDVYLLFQAMEADLQSVIRKGVLKECHTLFVIYQIARALKYLHSGSVIHRDLKPANILVNSNCLIRLCDFGLSRSFTHSSQNQPVMTQGVATRWYRAPEMLLGSKNYSQPVDVWSLGCIIYELVAQKPLFPGQNARQQLEKILSFTGVPSQEDLTGLQNKNQVLNFLNSSKISPSEGQSSLKLKGINEGIADLLSKIVVFNQTKRLNIDQILAHPVLSKYRKVSSEITRSSVFLMAVNDNIRLSAQQYRFLIEMNVQRCNSMPNLKVLLKKQSCKQVHETTQVRSKNNTWYGNKIQQTSENDTKDSQENDKQGRTEKKYISTANRSGVLKLKRALAYMPKTPLTKSTLMTTRGFLNNRNESTMVNTTVGDNISAGSSNQIKYPTKIKLDIAPVTNFYVPQVSKGLRKGSAHQSCKQVGNNLSFTSAPNKPTESDNHQNQIV